MKQNSGGTDEWHKNILSQKDPTRQGEDWNENREGEAEDVSKKGGHLDFRRFCYRPDHKVWAISDIGGGSKENGPKGYGRESGWILRGETGDFRLVEEMEGRLMEVQGEGEEGQIGGGIIKKG
jgi:hypothetical protein